MRILYRTQKLMNTDVRYTAAVFPGGTSHFHFERRGNSQATRTAET